MPDTPTTRDLDLVLFGASGSVGTVLAKYLAASGTSRKWALAGRSSAKLEDIQKQLPGGKPSIIIADVTDEQSMRAMARRTKVLMTTVGPYAEYGEIAVRACVDEGTHYCDITGEAFWVSRMHDKYGDRAVANGVCVVSFAGYDCVPFELGAYIAHRTLATGATPTRLVAAEALTTMSGGAPRGTILTCLSFPSQGPSLYLDWLAYVPPPERLAFARDLIRWALPSWSVQATALTLPEMMGAVSCTIVHRSAALLGYGGLSYNSRFDLSGSMRAHVSGGVHAALSALCFLGLLPVLTSYAVVAPLMAIGSLLVVPLLVLAPTRNALLRWVQATLQYDGDADATLIVRTRATGANGAVAQARLTMRGDPGIYVTATCLAETALAMLDCCASRGGAGGAGGPTALRAGFTTPMAACGEVLAERIRKSAGTSVEARLVA